MSEYGRSAFTRLKISSRNYPCDDDVSASSSIKVTINGVAADSVGVVGSAPGDRVEWRQTSDRFDRRVRLMSLDCPSF